MALNYHLGMLVWSDFELSSEEFQHKNENMNL